MRQPTAGRAQDALTATLERIEPEIRRVLLHFRIPAQDAEDLIQEVLLAYLTKQDTIAAVGPWILASLRNHCLVFWRRRRRRLIEAIDEGLLEELAGPGPADHERSDLAHDLSGALTRIPSRCRSILRLRYGLECAANEVAERLGYRPDTVRQATLRCLSALSRQLLASGYAMEGASS